MESTTEIIQESAEASMNEVEANVSGLVQYLQDHIPAVPLQRFCGRRLIWDPASDRAFDLSDRTFSDPVDPQKRE